MTRPAALLAGLVLTVALPASVPPAADPQAVAITDTPFVTYVISAELRPAERKLQAREVLTWIHRGTEPLAEMHLHLYANAFRDRQSTFFREGRRFRGAGCGRRPPRFGGVTLRSIRRTGGGELLPASRFIAPDDGNRDDRTVLNVPLGEPLAPGATLQLQIDYELLMPEIFARMGQEGDFFFFGQWFPKPGVLLAGNRWHCPQYHRNSEFFADFARFRVELTTPRDFKLGASGHLVSTTPHANGTVTRVYEESRIHDFAWTAWPRFREHRETMRLPGNSFDTELILLLAPDHEGDRQRYLQSLRFALTFFSERLFPYPYRTITLVDPPAGAHGAGGMEYPTLITGGTSRFLPAAIRALEMVTIHEFGHQYWYGMIASDEFREAWLDEGINTFFEMEAMEAYFRYLPSALDGGLLDIDDWELHRARAARLPGLDPVATESWRFLDGTSYGDTVYSKAGMLLLSLKNLVGGDRMGDFFRTYALNYRFRHPGGADFEREFVRHLGEDTQWAFDLFVRGSSNLDQAVERVSAVRLPGKTGRWRNEAVFSRREGYFPVELQVRLADGRVVSHFWKEKERWRRIAFEDTSPLREAVLDPRLAVPLDRDLLNNSRRLRPQAGGTRKLAALFGFLFQNLLALLPL